MVFIFIFIFIFSFFLSSCGALDYKQNEMAEMETDKMKRNESDDGVSENCMHKRIQRPHKRARNSWKWWKTFNVSLFAQKKICIVFSCC